MSCQRTHAGSAVNKLMQQPDSSASLFPEPSVKGAVLSFLVPGLGQWVRGYPLHAARVLAMGGLLGIITWELSHLGGTGAGFFFVLLIIVPWWCLQAYEASLPNPPGQVEALKTAWRRAHDIRYLGGLFLLTALTDLYVILANPEYSLTLFCSKPEGVPGLLAKVQSPALHLVIGYGFLTLRPWSLFVYVIYAGFGLCNALVNFACFGYGRIRTVFFLSLVAFTIYVFWRRSCFQPGQSVAGR